MSIKRLSLDTTILPAVLLPSIKAHVRVEHDRDDALLQAYIAGSIGLVERKCNVSLNPAEYMVTPDELSYTGSIPRSWLLPLNNVFEFTAVQSVDPGADDISANFDLWGSDFGGNASAYLVEVNGAGLPSTALLTLGVGVSDPTELAPDFFLLIARITGSMYENREASSALMGDGFDSELIGLWRPDA